ncbi:MAG: peroxide stress protein YaaA [Clostridia bacterium]|nr:peroxide stress protein YaaA [Clostridia bacterium]
MKIILSPAKQMTADADALAPTGTPQYIEEAREILSWLRSLSESALKALWNCNEQIAAQNIERLQNADLSANLTPAVLAYDGIAYKYMAPSVFEDGQFAYVEKNLRILSAFYGVLRAMDGIVPYRLEMQAKGVPAGAKNLYAFWGRKLYDAVRVESGVIVNLASKEYSKCITPYLSPCDRMITAEFLERGANGKLVTKATYAKMARGEMVRYLAERNAEDPEELKGFDRLGYVYRDDLSDDANFVFERIADAGAKA